MIFLLASVFMLIDHTGKVFFPDNMLLIAIGRLSFPLFCWGITRGYKVTRSFKHYALRLLLIAVLSQLPYYLVIDRNNLNVCFTLLAGLICLEIYDSKLKYFFKIPAIISVLVVSQIANFDYGIYGVLVILAFYIFGDKDIIVIIQGILALLYIIMFSIHPVQIVAALSTILIMFLKYKDFKTNKLLRYGFYPGHLIVLYIISHIL